MPELAELFSTQGARGGKPSAGGASKRPTASTPAYKSAGFERYPTAAQLNAAPPAKSPTKQAAKNTGRPPKDPPCTQGWRWTASSRPEKNRYYLCLHIAILFVSVNKVY